MENQIEVVKDFDGDPALLGDAERYFRLVSTCENDILLLLPFHVLTSSHRSCSYQDYRIVSHV